MRLFLICALIFLKACNSTDLKENPQSIYEELMRQRQAYMQDQSAERLDTVYMLVERLRKSADGELKKKAEQIKLGALFASCDFERLREYLPNIDEGVLDYEIQKKVYQHYCNAKLEEDPVSAVEEYEKATKLVLSRLKQDHSSMPAAMDLLYIKHNYFSEERLVEYIDSISDIYDNAILRGYDGSSYYEYSLKVDCKIPSYTGE